MTERTYLTRALQTLSEGNQVLVHANDETPLITRHLPRHRRRRGATLWPGLATSNTTKRRPCAWPRRRRSPTASSTDFALRLGRRRTGPGPVGEAVRTGEAQIVNDTHHGEHSLRPDALAPSSTGCDPCVPFPSRSKTKSSGMIAIYSSSRTTSGPTRSRRSASWRPSSPTVSGGFATPSELQRETRP